MKKKSLDVLLFEKGMVPSRERAKAIIMSGIVYVNNQKADKAGMSIPEDAEIEIRGKTNSFVSRGGLKIEKALTYFQIDPKDLCVMDIGASTGGFTDCLLTRGARKVYSIDVGYGQLAWKLRNDPRVVNLERIIRFNSRMLSVVQRKRCINISFVCNIDWNKNRIFCCFCTKSDCSV